MPIQSSVSSGLTDALAPSRETLLQKPCVQLVYGAGGGMNLTRRAAQRIFLPATAFAAPAVSSGVWGLDYP
jgi:hypothetical protein